MQHHVLARSTCSASNAYNTSIALSSTFLLCAGRHGPATPTPGRANGSQHLHFSTTRTRQKQIETAQDEERAKKLGAGGSLANYEALLDQYNASKTPSASAMKKNQQPQRLEYTRSVMRSVVLEPRRQSNEGPQQRSGAQEMSHSPRPSQSPDPKGNASELAETSPPEPLSRMGHRRVAPPFREVRRVETRRTRGVRRLKMHPDSPYATGPKHITREHKVPNLTTWQSHMLAIGDQASRISQLPKQEAKMKESDPAILAKMEYAPAYISAHPKALEGSTTVPWAVTPSARSGLQDGDLLDMECRNFEKYMELSAAELAARESVRNEVLAMINETLRDTDVEPELHGSEVTGLAMPTSDIDVRVPPIGSKHMQPVYSILSENPNFADVVFRKGSYPIVTAVHGPTGIAIQIVCAPSSEPQQRITDQYLSEIPHLRTTYTVLKTAFAVRGLIDVYTGGIGAYGLLIMLIAALKRGDTAAIPLATPGAQLQHFLAFYSTFDTRRHGLSVMPPRPFQKHVSWQGVNQKVLIDAARRRGDPVKAGQWAIGRKRKLQPYLLCLQDPANPTNDLGRKSNAIKHIRKTIQVLRDSLRGEMARYRMDAVEAEGGGEGESLLQPLVGRFHEVLWKDRGKVERFGMGVLARRMIAGGHQREEGESIELRPDTKHGVEGRQVSSELEISGEEVDGGGRSVGVGVGHGGGGV